MGEWLGRSRMRSQGRAGQGTAGVLATASTLSGRDLPSLGNAGAVARAVSVSSLTLRSGVQGPHLLYYWFDVQMDYGFGGTSTYPYTHEAVNGSWSIAVDGNTVVSGRGFQSTNPSQPQDPFEPGRFEQPVLMLPGQPVTFELVLRAQVATWAAHTGGGNSANATLSAFRSLSWGGVSRVTTNLGVPVTGYTLTDEFGNDWTTPAPRRPRWDNELGSGLAGTHGIPRAGGAGTLDPNSDGFVSLTHAFAGASGILCISGTRAATPILGGTLVPGFPLLDLPFVTSSSGTFIWPFVVPPGVPSGANLYFQFLVVDPAAVQGIAFSNAFSANFP